MKSRITYQEAAPPRRRFVAVLAGAVAGAAGGLLARSADVRTAAAAPGVFDSNSNGDALTALKTGGDGRAVRAERTSSGDGDAVEVVNTSTSNFSSGIRVLRDGTGTGWGLVSKRFGSGNGAAVAAFNESNPANPNPSFDHALLAVRDGAGAGHGVQAERHWGPGHAIRAVNTTSADAAHGVHALRESTGGGHGVWAHRSGSGGGDGVRGTRTDEGKGAGVHGEAAGSGSVAVRAFAESGAHALFVVGGPSDFNDPVRFDACVSFNDSVVFNKPVEFEAPVKHDGATHFVGAAGFAQIGMGAVPAGSDKSALVTHPLYTPDSCVVVTLTNDPGVGQGKPQPATVSWVEREAGGFVVHLTAPAVQPAGFCYFLARPANPAAVAVVCTVPNFGR